MLNLIPMIWKPAKRYQSELCRMCPICIYGILAISYDKPFVLFWGKVGSDCTRLFLRIVSKCIKSNNNVIKDESYFTLYKPKVLPTLRYFWRIQTFLHIELTPTLNTTQKICSNPITSDKHYQGQHLWIIHAKCVFAWLFVDTTSREYNMTNC